MNLIKGNTALAFAALTDSEKGAIRAAHFAAKSSDADCAIMSEHFAQKCTRNLFEQYVYRY